MKFIKFALVAVASLFLVTGSASATSRQSTLANVPTGVNVKGCTDYKLLPRNKVLQVCGKKAFLVNFKRRWNNTPNE